VTSNDASSLSSGTAVMSTPQPRDISPSSLVSTETGLPEGSLTSAGVGGGSPPSESLTRGRMPRATACLQLVNSCALRDEQTGDVSTPHIKVSNHGLRAIDAPGASRPALQTIARGYLDVIALAAKCAPSPKAHQCRTARADRTPASMSARTVCGPHGTSSGQSVAMHSVVREPPARHSKGGNHVPGASSECGK